MSMKDADPRHYTQRQVGACDDHPTPLPSLPRKKKDACPPDFHSSRSFPIHTPPRAVHQQTIIPTKITETTLSQRAQLFLAYTTPPPPFFKRSWASSGRGTRHSPRRQC
jgi:hypothetical protein